MTAYQNSEKLAELRELLIRMSAVRKLDALREFLKGKKKNVGDTSSDGKRIKVSDEKGGKNNWKSIGEEPEKHSSKNEPASLQTLTDSELKKYKNEINLGSFSQSEFELNPEKVANTPTTEKNIKDKISYYMTQWAGNSETFSSVLLKRAAKEEFGLKGKVLSGINVYHFTDHQIREAAKVVRKIYEQTQAENKKLFPTGKVTLYKGIYKGPDYGKKGSLSSWTSDEKSALFFTDKNNPEIIKKELTIDRVFISFKNSHWQEGKFGNQSEFIIME